VLGAASLAGIAEGVWASPADAAVAWREDAAFVPAPLPDADRRRAEWRKAVDRSRAWIDPDQDGER
jgi:glycerol kinase